MIGYFGDVIFISIHTPTQGVTYLFKQPLPKIPISIHTPTQGVTAVHMYIYFAGGEFQSTLPRRE